MPPTKLSSPKTFLTPFMRFPELGHVPLKSHHSQSSRDSRVHAAAGPSFRTDLRPRASNSPSSGHAVRQQNSTVSHILFSARQKLHCLRKVLSSAAPTLNTTVPTPP